jgi:hypothetical protein
MRQASLSRAALQRDDVRGYEPTGEASNQELAQETLPGRTSTASGLHHHTGAGSAVSLVRELVLPMREDGNEH